MSKIESDKTLNAIVDAVCYWLGYQFKIGRNQLIHEASLRYPIADTLTAKGIAINQIVLEQLHPIFKNKMIDLVIFDENVKAPEDENDDTNLKEVFEFKLAKIETSKEYGIEHQRVFDDILRLSYYNLWSNKDCYFLMCGEYEKFNSFFVSQKTINTEDKKIIAPLMQNQSIKNENYWKPDGLYKDWFSFSFGEEKVKVFDINDHDSWGLKPFQYSYGIREPDKYSYLNSIKVKTKCLAITSPRHEGISTHAAGIWKIEAIQ